MWIQPTFGLEICCPIPFAAGLVSPHILLFLARFTVFNPREGGMDDLPDAFGCAVLLTIYYRFSVIAQPRLRSFPAPLPQPVIDPSGE